MNIPHNEEDYVLKGYEMIFANINYKKRNKFTAF